MKFLNGKQNKKSSKRPLFKEKVDMDYCVALA